MKTRFTVAAALAFVSFGALAEQVGEWTYLLTPGNVGRTNSMVGNRNGHTLAHAQLFKEDDGTYQFRLQGMTADECLNRKIPALVEDTATDLVITPSKRFFACPSMRLVVKKDGSGGVVQLLMGKKNDQSWVTDEEHEYGLKAR